MKAEEDASSAHSVLGGSEIPRKFFDNLDLKGSALQGNQIVALFCVQYCSVLKKNWVGYSTVVHVRGLAIKFSIRVRSWRNELQPPKCSSTFYQQFAGVRKSSQ